MEDDFMFCKRSRMKGFENLLRKAKLQTASKRVPKKHRDGENFKYSKTWCTDSITLSYYAIHLLLSKEN